jgi:F-type H+-transporting ATPase subunit epsilon
LFVDTRSSGVTKQLRVDLVSVEARIWSGESEMLVARTTDGELGVLPGHESLLGQLAEPSQVRIKRTGADELCYDVTGGFLSVSPDGVTVLAENCSSAPQVTR